MKTQSSIILIIDREVATRFFGGTDAEEDLNALVAGS